MWLERLEVYIKFCYYLIKIFLHNKIHFKINSIIYKNSIIYIRVYIYKVITVGITR